MPLQMPFPGNWVVSFSGCRRFFFFFFLAVLVAEVRAQSFSGNARSPLVTNYSGILVAGGGALGTLAVEAGYDFRNSGGATTSRFCQIGFRLLDAGGGAVPLTGATDPAGTIVFSDAFVVALEPGGVNSGTAGAALVPVAALVTGEAYQIEAQLYVRSPFLPFTYSPTGAAAVGDPYRFTVLPDSTEPPGGGRRVTGWVNTLMVSQAHAVATVTGGEAFRVEVRGAVGRLDHLAAAAGVENFNVQLDATLTGRASGAVALMNPRTTLPAALANHTAAGGPASFAIAHTVELRPVGQLDSTDSFTLTVSLAVTSPENVTSPQNSITQAAQRMLHFNGTLRFGGVAARINALDNAPEPLGPAVGGGEATALDLPAGGITIVGAPGFTVGMIAGLPVTLRADGTAQAAGSTPTGGPAGVDAGTVNGVSFTRTNVTLGSGGATADVRVFFPAGFGVAKDRNTRRQLASFDIAGAALDGALNPSGGYALAASDLGLTALYAAHEQLPVLFETTLIFWDPAAGTFNVRRDATHYVRTDELDTLDALLNPLLTPPLVDATAAQRPSNEGYFRRPDASPAVNVVVTADAQGRAVLTTARVDLPAAEFTPHFPPVNTTVTWTQPGAVVLQNGALDLAQSSLPGANEVAFSYSPNCPSTNPLAPPVAPLETVSFKPAGNLWTFTADGGLRAAGDLAPTPLKWGARPTTPVAYAHVTGNFTAGNAHLAGHVLRGAAGVALDDDQPGALLYSGHGRPGNAAYVERPGTTAYADGFADYAGVNFRVASDGAQTATSRIADASLGPYTLRATSKYYVRPGGVSGIHEAVTASFTALLSGFQPYGFPTTLSGLQLAYRDNHNVDSLISGTINVPGVRGTTGFTQPFDRLALRCDGQLGDLALPNPNNVVHTLHYWRAQFKALAAEFRHLPDDAPTRHALVFGAEVSLPGLLQDKLHGGLGFFSSGNLVTTADGFVGVSSRLRRPAQLSLNGRRSAFDPSRPGFALNPVTDIYFNNALDPAAPNTGFVSVAGRVDVPFFEDLEIHILAQATTGTTLMRGGWTEGGKNFFNDTKFDAANRGFSPGGFADYAANPGFDPHVKKKWLDFADFDFPVTWDPVRRQFASSTNSTEKDFLVVKTHQILEKLTPTTADLRFGAQFAGLPRLNLAALVADEDEAANQIIQHLPGGAGSAIASATKALEALLNGRSDVLLNAAVDAAVDGYLDQMFQPGGPLNAVTNAAAAQAALTGTANTLRTNLAGLIGGASDAGKVLGEIKAALDKLEAGLAAADVILQKDGTGARGTFLTATVSIGGTTGQSAAAKINTLINTDLRETLDEIQSRVSDLHRAVTQVNGQLTSIQSLLTNALAGVNGGGAADLPATAVAAMQNYFATASDPAGRYLAELGPAKIRADLKQLVRDQVHASPFVADLQRTLRDQLQPLRDEFNLAFERMHGVINDVLRAAFSELGNALAGPLGEESKINRAVGTFSSTLQLAKIEGTARIEGDTLVSAHLGAELGLQVPDRVGISGWIDYHNYKSGQPTPRCAGVVGADGRVEITVGAEGGASIQGNPPVHAKLVGRYAMTATGAPLAASGELLFETDIKFDQMTLKQVHFKFAFGEHDNYLFAQGAGSIWFLDANVRAFLGQTCDPEMLATVDPRIGEVLDLFKFGTIAHTNPITGLYWNGDGEGSLNRFFGIPDSKLLSIRGKGGHGYFSFFNQSFPTFGLPPTDAKLILGVRSRYGASVSLALVTAEAELVLFGAIDPLPMVRDVASGFAKMQESIFARGGLLPFVVKGFFTPSFELGVAPLSYKKSITFKASAKGAITPSPPAPPPGFIWVNDISF